MKKDDFGAGVIYMKNCMYISDKRKIWVIHIKIARQMKYEVRVCNYQLNVRFIPKYLNQIQCHIIIS